ncbi:hypothetical protein BH09BAC6_BH09BAC6_36890 [soil metagenome]|jgi:hypothetical protein
METINPMSARSLQYYVIDRRWASDLQFYNIETAFLLRLLDDYFIRINNQGQIHNLKALGKKIYQLESDICRCDQKLRQQIETLEQLSEDARDEDPEVLAVHQVHLELGMTKLITAFRDIKGDIFKMIEKVMREDKYAAG